MKRRGHLAPLAPLAAAALSLTVSAVAFAQDRDSDAERLFREGQKLLEERRYGEACPKFEQAYRKDGQLGTLLNLAFCHKEQGATWYAWLEFREAELKAIELNRPDRRDFAKSQLPALEKSLAKVVVDNPKGYPLVEVLVEDRRVPAAEKGSPFAVEPGRERKFTFLAKGKKSTPLLVNVTSKGDKPMHVVVPDMEDAPPEPIAAEPAPDTSEGVESHATIPAARAERPTTQSSQKTLALGAFGVAAIGGVVMTVAGIMTFTNDCASLGNRDNCKNDQAGQDEKSRGETTATIATIGGIVMLAGAAAGIALWITSPKEADTKSSHLRVRLLPGGVAGTF